jgi:tetratricopeptide (TPR) repeat protein
MNMKAITGKVLLILSVITLFCIPVSGYTAEAMNLYGAGRDLLSAGNYTGAVASYNQAISLEPAYFEAWNGIADALNRNGQFDDALDASNRSLTINPDYVNGWINRGQILYNIGYRYEDSENDIKKADALYMEQLGAFEKAVFLDPNNAEAWFNKGYALAGMKRYDEAIAAFDQVRVINPAYPNLQKNREIAVQLRDKSGTSPVTTQPANPTTGTAQPATSSPVIPATSAKPSPLPAVTGIISLVAVAILVLQRK